MLAVNVRSGSTVVALFRSDSRQYSYVGIALNELTDLTLVCTPSQLNSAGKCPVTDGSPSITSLVRPPL